MANWFLDFVNNHGKINCFQVPEFVLISIARVLSQSVGQVSWMIWTKPLL